ncbi:MAG: hypothetical protein VXW44_09370 [SAR324 cluster bacterium]|nr:hypothetical protein [SAR324 cluster bacterium]
MESKALSIPRKIGSDMVAFLKNYVDVLNNMHEHHRLYFFIHAFMLVSALLMFLIVIVSMI